jgi:hypothetical protein
VCARVSPRAKARGWVSISARIRGRFLVHVSLMVLIQLGLWLVLGLGQGLGLVQGMG